MLSISIIIPTLNEENEISSLLRYLNQLDPNLQSIVVDGGSRDNTVQKAKSHSTVITAPQGRGAQMNAGACIAEGDILWFLHADCMPHPNSIEHIRVSLKDPDVVGGGFEYTLNHPAKRFRIVEYLSNYKNRRFELLYGDMGIFVRRSIFKRMEGYREIPLMEDMDFSKRLKRMGKIVVLPYKIRTSARRWLEDGYIRSCVRSWILQSSWALGVSPFRLAKWYRFE